MGVAMSLAEFYTKFQVEQNLIYKSKYWSLSLRPAQPTLGSCVISLNRYCEKLSDITEQESADFKEVVTYAEKALTQAFNYDKINYLMLMMVDPHLHYHVIPRYSSVREFAQLEWKDTNWPTPPDLGGTVVDRKAADKIINQLQSAVSL